MTSKIKKKLPPRIKVGDIFTSNDFGDVEVVYYIDWVTVYIQFKTTGYVSKVNTSNLRRGAIRDPHQPTVYGVGFTEGKSYIKSVAYTTWCDMLRRCYHKKHKGYSRYGGRGVTVSAPWLYYSNFKSWWEKTYKGGAICLDKDILVQNSKVYSEETCCLLPDDLNKMILTANERRGLYPVGVSKGDVVGATFRMRVSDKRKGLIAISGYADEWAAFSDYKELKLANIRYAAEKELTKGTITQEIYNALLRYEVVPYPE